MRFAGFADAGPRLFLRILLLLAAAGGQAARAQDIQPPPQHPQEQARALYQQGVQALQDRQFDRARQLLSQVVALEPGFAGAWLDLALATHAAGDAVQAEEFLTILEQRFDVPPPLAQAVATLRERIAAGESAAQPPRRGWTWRSTVQAGAGRDSNANAGLALNDLTLTLPGGGVVLPVDPGLRPRPDSFGVAGASVSGLRNVGRGQLELAASVKGRRNVSARDFDTVDLQAGVGWATTDPLPGGGLGGLLPGPWRVGLAAQHLKLGGSGLLNSVVLSGSHIWVGARCNPQLTLESDWRTFPVAPNLDSRTLWLGGSASCPGLWAQQGGRWTAQLRAGAETARSAFLSANGRPGGDTRHIEATVSHAWNWTAASGTAHKLELQAQWARASDTEGYSPLLASNARRDVRRSTAGISYTVPLGGAADGQTPWLGTLALQGFRQRSNLELFRLSGRIVQLGVQRSW